MKTLFFTLLSAIFTVSAWSQQEAPESLIGNNTSVVAASLSNFDALQKGNTVQLSWTAVAESNIGSHEIQRSSNGSAFTSIGTVVAQNNSAPYKYTFLDATPTEGVNYYRLASTDKSGKVIYSNILQVNNGYRRSELVVLPNPVQGNVINLQLGNFNSGKYTITLYSNGGQKLFAQSMNFSDGSSTQIINVPRNIGRGLYFLQVSDGETRINKQIMLQ